MKEIVWVGTHGTLCQAVPCCWPTARDAAPQPILSEQRELLDVLDSMDNASPRDITIVVWWGIRERFV
jgi:hypothetical protein